jgi:hypothetical protein
LARVWAIGAPSGMVADEQSALTTEARAGHALRTMPWHRATVNPSSDRLLEFHRVRQRQGRHRAGGAIDRSFPVRSAALPLAGAHRLRRLGLLGFRPQFRVGGMLYIYISRRS